MRPREVLRAVNVPRTADRNSLRDGHAAETMACRHLEMHGLKLLERNVRSPYGEIDLVMRDGVSLVFVEVRRRGSERFGTPAETVGPRKQQRLRATAEHYLQRHPEQRDLLRYG